MLLEVSMVPAEAPASPLVHAQVGAAQQVTADAKKDDIRIVANLHRTVDWPQPSHQP